MEILQSFPYYLQPGSQRDIHIKIHVEKDFLIWFLIGWQYVHQPIRNHVTELDFNKDLCYKISQAPEINYFCESGGV